eukprot:3452693-Prymnesium_polylepis.1
MTSSSKLHRHETGECQCGTGGRQRAEMENYAGTPRVSARHDARTRARSEEDMHIGAASRRLRGHKPTAPASS